MLRSVFVSARTVLGPSSRVLRPTRWSSTTSFTSDKNELGDPIFAKEILSYLTPKSGQRFLDLTFGDGGHSSMLLDNCPEVSVVAVDCDRRAYETAVDMEEDMDVPGRLVPLRARFSQVPALLSQQGYGLHSFDGVLIESGTSQSQKADEMRGFRSDRNGWLDLRFDPDLQPDAPTATELLRHLEDRELWQIFKTYGGMKSRAKFAASAIVEARYMFNDFRTVEDLYEALRSGARRMSETTGEQEQILSTRMIGECLTALRRFVNDELNELHFAISVVAENFLKPNTGILLTILQEGPEVSLAYDSLHRLLVPIDHGGNLRMTSNQVRRLQHQRLWETLNGNGQKPSTEERRHRPGHRDCKLFVAKRTNMLRVYDSQVPKEMVHLVDN